MVDENGLDVISEASSCSLNLRDEYHHILGIDNAKVRPHIHMVTPFLYQLFKEGKPYRLKPLKLRGFITPHATWIKRGGLHTPWKC